MPGSRGVPEQWSHTKTEWIQVGHQQWEKKQATNLAQHIHWANLNWHNNQANQQDSKELNETSMQHNNDPIHLRHLPGNQSLKPDGSIRKRGKGKGINYTRGGKKRHRNKDTDTRSDQHKQNATEPECDTDLFLERISPLSNSTGFHHPP